MAVDHTSGRSRRAGGHRHPASAGVAPGTFAHWRSTPKRPVPVVADAGPVSRFFIALGHRAAELLNVCAAYLGIAVIVTLVLVFTIAPLRSQVVQIHQSVLAALKPASVDDVLYAMLAIDEDNRALLEGLTGTLTMPMNDVDEALPAEAAAGNEDANNFAGLLRASAQAGQVEGITAAQEQALRNYLARKYRIASSVAGALINTAFVVAREMDLDPQLILAVIAIESRYNPYAESHVGAQGLMQVMTRVHKEKFTEFSDGTIAALHPIANMRVGSRILRDCIDRRGSIERGLACYVGATGPSDGGYGAKVLAERRRIALASGIPVGR